MQILEKVAIDDALQHDADLGISSITRDVTDGFRPTVRTPSHLQSHYTFILHRLK